MLVNVLVVLCVQIVQGLRFVSEAEQKAELQIVLPQYGKVQGMLRYSVDNSNSTYYSFEGIPYAKPPVGSLRFKPPEEPSPWTGTLDATGTSPPPICIQIPSLPTAPLKESENCLYLNIYTPSLTSPTLKPVMVWIYGGGFLFGKATSAYYGPDYLLAHNIILVHFNYRLNVFGFLSTSDLSSPGNYGLKDQSFALKWIQKNIQYFGGNHSEVTIFGESAGGASVQYHLMASQSRGLFRAAISESGSALCSWAYLPRPGRIAREIGAVAGFSGGSNLQLVEFLRKLTAKQLTRAANIVTIKNTLNFHKTLPFSPSVEPEHPEAFMTKNTYKILESGEFSRVPYLVGFNSQESAGAQALLEMTEGVLQFVANGEVLVPPGLKTERKGEAAEEIKRFYFGDGSVAPSQQVLNFISDSYFYRPITESARLYSISTTPIYMYRFSYEGYYLGKKAMSLKENTHINGVQHAEEVWYIFSRQDLTEANTTDKLVRDRMVTMWTNFAKFLKPTLNESSWPQYNPTSEKYLDISSKLEVRERYKAKTMLFWRNLFKKYADNSSTFNTY